MDMLALAIQLTAGSLGGFLIGRALPGLSLGIAGNLLTGLIGGLLGGSIILSLLGLIHQLAVKGLDAPAFIAQVSASGVGGAVVTLCVGFLRRSLGRV